MSKYGKYIVSDLKASHFSEEFNAKYAQWATRILWMERSDWSSDVCSSDLWYLRPPATEMPQDHSHSHDTDEIIGFFGSDPQDPYDLGGEVEFWLEDEQHMITRSSLIFVPRGMKHCPLLIRRVDRPIFHFSTVTGGQYDFIEGQKKE